MTAARPDTWMPMYWGDYLSDTGHLSTEQHGAYLLLIGHYWKTGRPLPDDGEQLCRIARMAPATWKRSRDLIAAFFKISDGVWRHGRIDSELAKAVAFLEKQKGNGGKGGRPKNPDKSQNNPGLSSGITQTEPKPNPDHNPKITTSPSPSYSESVSNTESSLERPSLDDPPAASPRSSGKYAFEGEVIRLTHKDFNKWRVAYTTIPDLTAELTAMDDWIRGQDEKSRKGWFHIVSGALRNKHTAIALRAAETKPGGGLIPRDF